MTEGNASKFALAVWDLYNCGFLMDVHQQEPGVFVARETQGWNEVAAQLAERLPGSLIPAKGAGGVVWINGNSKANPAPHGVIVAADRAPGVALARSVALQLGVLHTVNRPVYSYGALSRLLIRWAIPEATKYEPSCERFLDNVKFGYHCCSPGEYVARETPWIDAPMQNLFSPEGKQRNPEYKPALTLYDVTAYYFTMICKLPCLRVSPDFSGLRFGSFSPDEKARWKDVLDAVSESKLLRNSIAGALLGSTKKGTAYTSGKPRRQAWYKTAKPEKQAEVDAAIAAWIPGTVRKIQIPGGVGLHRAAGLLVVRSGYEICQQAAMQTEAKYGTIDSVATVGKFPDVWKRRGFEVSVKASGDGEICHRGSYRIGELATKFYKREQRNYKPTDYGTEPPIIYNTQWF